MEEKDTQYIAQEIMKDVSSIVDEDYLSEFYERFKDKDASYLREVLLLVAPLLGELHPIPNKQIKNLSTEASYIVKVMMGCKVILDREQEYRKMLIIKNTK